MALPTVVVAEPLPAAWLERLRGCCETVTGLAPSSTDRDAEGLLTTLNVAVDAALLDRFSRLKVIGNMAVGFDNVDIAECARRGVAVGNTPGVLTAATADLTMALLLASARRIAEAAQDARDGRWGPWSPTGWLGADLHGATLGIVGAGQIGSAVARRAHGFGLRVVYVARSDRAQLERDVGARRVDLDVLLECSDFVSIHLPLSDDTRGLINASALARMKPSARLINTARGGVVDQKALLEALHDGTIAGAALDVTTPEPLPTSHPLFAHPRCLVVPHIGSATEGTRRRMAELACDNVVAGLRGDPLPHAVEVR